MFGLRLSVPDILQVRLWLNPTTGKAPPSLIWAEAKGTVIMSQKKSSA